MLVLTRRPHQSIMIGDEVVVTVLEVKGDQIRLGISAPRHVQVFREEVLLALREANRSAVLDKPQSTALPVPAPTPPAVPAPAPQTAAAQAARRPVPGPGPRGGQRPNGTSNRSKAL